MKRYRVPVEVWAYYGVYVYAENENDAKDKVDQMIDNGNIKFDDNGDDGINVAECGFVDEIDEYGNNII